MVLDNDYGNRFQESFVHLTNVIQEVSNSVVTNPINLWLGTGVEVGWHC